MVERSSSCAGQPRTRSECPVLCLTECQDCPGTLTSVRDNVRKKEDENETLAGLVAETLSRVTSVRKTAVSQSKVLPDALAASTTADAAGL